MKQNNFIETRSSESSSEQVSKQDKTKTAYFAHPPTELLEFIEANWNDSDVTGNFMLSWMKECEVQHQTASLHLMLKLLERRKISEYKLAYIACSFVGAASLKGYKEGYQKGTDAWKEGQ